MILNAVLGVTEDRAVPRNHGPAMARNLRPASVDVNTRANCVIPLSECNDSRNLSWDRQYHEFANSLHAILDT